MQKIPTLFLRDEHGKITDQITPGCEWVIEGQGIATEKLDGMNVRLTTRQGEMVRLEKRRNPTKVQKSVGIREPWYVDTHKTDPADRHLFAAAQETDTRGWHDGEHCCEAIGPNIQGNPLGFWRSVCFPFDLKPHAIWFDARLDTSLDRASTIRDTLEHLESRLSPGHLAEGIVFHHPDGRRAKIKRKDFQWK